MALINTCSVQNDCRGLRRSHTAIEFAVTLRVSVSSLGSVLSFHLPSKYTQALIGTWRCTSSTFNPFLPLGSQWQHVHQACWITITEVRYTVLLYAWRRGLNSTLCKRLHPVYESRQEIIAVHHIRYIRWWHRYEIARLLVQYSQPSNVILEQERDQTPVGMESYTDPSSRSFLHPGPW